MMISSIYLLRSKARRKLESTGFSVIYVLPALPTRTRRRRSRDRAQGQGKQPETGMAERPSWPGEARLDRP
jgi:hypothetical protein